MLHRTRTASISSQLSVCPLPKKPLASVKVAPCPLNGLAVASFLHKRNSILNAMPRWLVLKAITEAKKGVRKKIENFINEKSLAAAQIFIVSQLKKVGVTEVQILQKTERSTIEGLTIDDIVQLSGDEKSISSGSENVDALFEKINNSNSTNSLKDLVRSKVVDQSKINKDSDEDINILNNMKVTIGKKQGQYLVNDGEKEFIVGKDENDYYCSCKISTDGLPATCLHAIATQQFLSLGS